MRRNVTQTRGWFLPGRRERKALNLEKNADGREEKRGGSHGVTILMESHVMNYKGHSRWVEQNWKSGNCRYTSMKRDLNRGFNTATLQEVREEQIAFLSATEARRKRKKL